MTSKEAYELFMTPPRMPERARREQQLLDRGEPLEIRVQGQRVVGHRWGEGKTVLVQHGWGSRGTAMWAFIQAIEPHFQVIAMDAPGHGDSEGSRSNMFLFAHTIAEESKAHGPLHAIVAHSIGATAIPKATTLGANANKYVLISARNELNDFLTRFFELSGVDAGLTQAVHQHWADEFGWDSVIAATPSLLVPNIERPALIIHDSKDEDIRVEEAHAIHAAWPGSELHITDGLGHVRITRSTEVAERVRDFLLR